MSIKEMVQNGRKVYFKHYQKGTLWYVTECGFEFPVPMDETGDAVFQNEDKAMFFMRWIRKHIAEIEAARQLQAESN